MTDDKSPSQKPPTPAFRRRSSTYAGVIHQVVFDRNVSKICTIIDKLSIIINPLPHGVLHLQQEELDTDKI